MKAVRAEEGGKEGDGEDGEGTHFDLAFFFGGGDSALRGS